MHGSMMVIDYLLILQWPPGLRFAGSVPSDWLAPPVVSDLYHMHIHAL
jgi:hypothetical protein